MPRAVNAMNLFTFNFFFRFTVAVLLVHAAFVVLSAQDLPDRIRGYKVHHTIIKLDGSRLGSAEKAFIVVDTPKVSDVSFGGITLAVAGELDGAGYDGRVDMMTFRDFRVNGVSVEIAEFTTSFVVNKHGRTVLPSSATVFLPSANILNAAWKEITDSKDDWTVTGRIFVFGKFKKFGFSFKRVIPVDVLVVTKNPLLQYRKSILS